LRASRGAKTTFMTLRIDLEMIDPFNISLDIRDRGWVSEAEPHPHKFDEFNGAPFGSSQGTPFQWIIFYMDYPNTRFQSEGAGSDR
jgi:hypothetical protein